MVGEFVVGVGSDMVGDAVVPVSLHSYLVPILYSSTYTLL